MHLLRREYHSHALFPCRCDARHQWRGSASEQRLLTSLGLWEIAAQAKEWEEAEAEAAQR